MILGAGPAGLTAAYLLSKQGVPVDVLEADPVYVGGIARTVQYKGFHFDIGGHRFFSKSGEVEDLWTEILGPDMIDRPRSSRIFYNGRFFAYPLKAFDALRKLGVMESSLCMLSYLWAQARPNAEHCGGLSRPRRTSPARHSAGSAARRLARSNLRIAS